MLGLSSKTQVDKKFKLSELYKLIGVSKQVKSDAANIVSVTLANVLNADTMNFTVTKDVKEIYVFEIALSSKSVPALFISALDRAIDFHTVFALKCCNQTLLYGAYKEYGEKGIKVGKYYATNWRDERQLNVPMSATCLDDVYKAIIDELIPILARAGETACDLATRYETITRLQKEIDKLQRMVDAEKQPQKRFKLNAELKELKKELEKNEL